MEIKEFIENNPKLVRMSESVRYPGLFVIKYRKRVFYDNLWNSILEECRGLVVDADFNIVSRPFTKIYNYGIEARAPEFEPNEPVRAFKKINGFMVAATWHNRDILVSTTGSLDSEYVDYAYEMMENLQNYRAVLSGFPDFTFMFECVHPSDPHIIVEEPGMYLLGMREKTWDSKVITHSNSFLASCIGCYSVPYMNCFVSALVNYSKTCQHEGFVFYAKEGRAAKIKTPYYLTSKFVARNPRTDKLMRPDIKNSLDEEYYPLIDYIQDNIESYTALNEQDRLVFVREFLSGN